MFAIVQNLTCLSSAHSLLVPSDPSLILERIIADGLQISEKNREKALFFSDSVHAARTIFNRGAIWTSRTQLKVCFWNGSDVQKIVVAKSAQRWNRASKISLSLLLADGKPRKCVSGDDSNIRVSLSSEDSKLKYEDGQDPSGNWSLIGRQSEFVPIGKSVGSRYEVTMNLPYVGQNLSTGDMAELDFTVGHEFGHALGLLHEFQSVRCKGWIDIDQLAIDQGWYGPAAHQNLDPLPSLTGQIRIDYGLVGEYDLLSIMQYNFAAKYYIVKASEKNPCMRNKDVTAPSKSDLATVAAIYGTEKTAIESTMSFKFGAAEKVVRERLKSGYAFANKANGDMASALSAVLNSIDRLDKFEKGILAP